MSDIAFGIDFGTTHTRVAFFDGRKLRMVPFFDEKGQHFQVPSLVGYADGQAVAFGREAAGESHWTVPPESIKWLLGKEDPIEIDGSPMDPVDIVCDFFRYIRKTVGETIRTQPLKRAAISIPVHYPPRARMRLQHACRRAGIEVTHFFFEPVAALYCDLFAHPASGVSAVFDWGGGSLDIATVRIEGNVAITRRTDGWHRGGEDFDRLICNQALQAALDRQPDTPFTAEEILERTNKGRQLQLRAEACKIELSGEHSVPFFYPNLTRNIDIDFSITAGEFQDWISQDVSKAIRLLEKAIRETGVTPALLTRLFLSGGTCNIPLVKRRLEREIAGERIVSQIAIPSDLRLNPGGLDDIGNATALGTALLAVHGTYPVFANDIGVRLADGTAAADRFYPVFNAGDPVTFGVKRQNFFVTDAGSGVARLLVCDRLDEVLQPEGRLLRLIPVPIDRKETWIDVEFSVDRHLVLQVKASGRIARAASEEPAWIQQLDLGFKMPEVGTSQKEIDA